MIQAAVFRSSLPPPPIQPSPVLSALRGAAADPDRPAVIDGATGQRHSRGELAAQSAVLASALAERGVGRGDLVAVALPNTAWWPVIALGIWRAGAAVAPFGLRWTAEETRRALARVRPRVAVTAGPSVSLLREAGVEAGIDLEVVAHGQVEGATPLEALLEAGGVDPVAEPRLAPTDLAVVPFSSGTGGLPKGVRLTHANLAASSAQVALSLGFDADTVALAAVPFSHVMGLGLSLCVPLGVGARIVTLPVPDTGRVLELTARHRVTHATVPVPIFTELATDPRGERHDTSSLELLATAGARVPAGVEVAAGRRLGALARQGYGMTEATTMISGPMGLGRPGDPGTVGWLAAGTEARLVDPDNGRDVAPGQPGELWIRGPQVMDGYFDDPAATAATLTADGMAADRRPGDHRRRRPAGRGGPAQGADQGRRRPGRPAELELLLGQHPAVRDAAVVGRPDPEAGEVPVAYVVLSGPATPDELIAFTAPRLAAHKRPRDVRIVDRLPRLPTGKLQRHRLRDRERHAAAAGARAQGS